MKINVRAMPVLELYDKITVVSPSTNINKEYRIKEISNVYEGSLSGYITVSVPADKTAGNFVFIAPGLAIER